MTTFERALVETLGSSTRFAPSLGGLLRQLQATLQLWSRRARSRRELRELDDHLLRDIGISRGVAEHEAAKPFWRA